MGSIKNQNIKPYKNLFNPKPFKYKTLKISMFKKERKPEVGEHKFCPVCGTRLQLQDAFCLKCGYSFVTRVEKGKKKVNLKNTAIIIAILILAYLGLRYAGGQTIIPRSFTDALRTLWPK